MEYNAFLSYSHAADDTLAPALQSALHQFARPWHKLRAVRVFRDKTNLSANPALWDAIEAALADSDYFLLLASPAAAQSKWVRREVEWWLSYRPADHLLVLLTDGELVWNDATADFDWDKTNCLPRALQGRFPEEPLYVDFRWARAEENLSLRHSQFRAAVLDIGATLHGRPKDELDGEDVRQHRRFKRAAWMAAALLVALTIASAIAAYDAMRNSRLAQDRRRQAERANVLEREARRRESEARKDAVQQRDEAKHQQMVAEQRRREAEEQRKLAEKRRTEAERQGQIALARQLAAQSELTRAERGDMLPRSVLLAIESARRYPSLEADHALRTSLSLLPPLVASFPAGGSNTEVTFTPDGQYLITTEYKSARMWDVTGGREVTLPCGPVRTIEFSADGQFMAALRGNAAHVFRVGDRSECARIAGDAPFTGLSLSRDGRYLCTRSEPELRVWELPSGREITRVSPEAQQRGFAFAPDSKSVAFSTGKGAVVELDLRTSREVSRKQLKGNIRSIRYSPDGKYVAISSTEETGVWEVALASRMISFTHPDTGPYLIFSPNSKHLATVSTLKTVKLIHLEAARNMDELAHDSDINALAFSPDAMYLATASSDKTARIWDVARGSQLQRLNHGSNVAAVAFSPKGKVVATGAYDTAARVWDISSGRELRRFTHEPYVRALAFSPDGNYLATAGANVNVRVWRADAGGELVSFHSERASALALDRNGAKLAVAEPSEQDLQAGQKVQVLDVATGRRLQTIAANGGITDLKFTDDGSYLVTGGKVWDVSSGRIVFSVRDTGAVVSASGKVAVGRNTDQSASVWDMERGVELARIRHARRMTLERTEGRLPLPRYVEKWGIGRVAISPDGNFVATAGDYLDGSVGVWNARDGTKVAQARIDVEIERMLFSPDRKCMALAASGLWLWRLNAGQQAPVQLSSGTSVFSLAFSPDGRYLAAGVGDYARLWEVSRLREVAVMRHTGILVSLVYGMAFTTDGCYLATASRDGNTRVWEIPSGREVSRMSFGDDNVTDVQFALRGRYVATKSNRGVALWLWRPEDLIEDACKRLLRNLTEDEWRQYLIGERYRKTCAKLPD